MSPIPRPSRCVVEHRIERTTKVERDKEPEQKTRTHSALSSSLRALADATRRRPRTPVRSNTGFRVAHSLLRLSRVARLAAAAAREGDEVIFLGRPSKANSFFFCGPMCYFIREEYNYRGWDRSTSSQYNTIVIQFILTKKVPRKIPECSSVPVFQCSSVPVEKPLVHKSHEKFPWSSSMFWPGTLEHWNNVRVLSMTKST